MKFSNLDKQIEEYCSTFRIMGTVRVTVQGKVEFQKSIGFADIENRIPFNDDSMYTFYSLSKPFCALGLLRLKDKHLLDLDTHPSKYVHEATEFDERVTVRHLLHHTSGLPDFEQNRNFCEKHLPGFYSDIRKHLTELANEPMYFDPGCGSKYANVNFVLCALIIENISGLSYSKYMEKEVFAPLGMKTAVVDNENLVIPHRVKGYELHGDVLTEVQKSHNWMFGAGDIVGKADDVYCLNKAIKHRLLVSEETWEEVLTPSPVSNMGMGCAVSFWHGKKRITHSGGHIGFRTMHIQLPEDDFDIIILSNSGFGNARDDISEMIYNSFYGVDDCPSEAVPMDIGYI